MEESIPLKLDPGLISTTAFKDPFQTNPEDLSLFNLITRVNHERDGEFLALNEEDLQNEIINEKIRFKLAKQREINGDDSAKSELERYLNIFKELTPESEDYDDKKNNIGSISNNNDDYESAPDPLDDSAMEIDEGEGSAQTDKQSVNKENLEDDTQNEAEQKRILTEKLALEKARLQKFYDNKNDLGKLIRSSLNEASLSLDFISLLVTSLRPNVGKTSMSPHLKQFIPLGSLNSDRIAPPEDNGENASGAANNSNNNNNNNDKTQSKQVNKMALVSWKLESLENAVRLIGAKLVFLKSDVIKEKNYFENLHRISFVDCLNFVNSRDILSTNNNDLNNLTKNFKRYEEVLFKVSNADIAIKYGYQDSGSRYKLNRGIAVLKKSKTNGELIFVPVVTGSASAAAAAVTAAGSSRAANPSNKSSTLENKVVVKLYEKVNNEFILVSESSIFDKNNNGNDNNAQTEQSSGVNFHKIQKEINKARNRIFEEELFYQLVKEAKLLLPYGVKIVSNSKITVELEDELIEISYVTMNIDEELETQRRNAEERQVEARSLSASPGAVGEAGSTSSSADGGSNNSIEKDLEKLIKNNKKADYIINFLRLMLCYYHKKNLYENSSNNSNNVVVIPGSNIPLLLRPLIGHINHEKFLKKLIKSLILLYEEDLEYRTQIIDSKLNKLVYKSFNKVNEDKQILKSGKNLEISLTKNHNVSYDKNNIFNKITTPTGSLLTIKETNSNTSVDATGDAASASSQDPAATKSKSTFSIKLTVKTSSSRAYCDSLINLVLLDTAKDEELLNVNYSDIAEIQKCLRWINSQYF